MVPVFGVLIYSLCCVCAGAAALRLAGSQRAWAPSIGPAAYCATLFLLGAGLLASLWLFIALAAALTPAAVAATLGACALLGARPVALLMRPIGRQLRVEYEWWLRERAGLKLLSAMAVVVFLLFGLAALIKPPAADAEAYYLTYPKIIAAAQRLTPMPGTYYDFSRVGTLAEMHFAALLVAGGGWSAAKFFLWPISIAAGVLLMGIASRVGLGRAGQWLTLVIMVTSTAFSNLVPDGKVDLFAAAWGIAAFYWALDTTRERNGKVALALCGLCAGFATVAKLTYLGALLPALALMIGMQHYSAHRHGSARSLVTSLAIFAFWTGMAVAPHLIKNALLFGEPLTPFVGAARNSYDNSYYAPEDTLWILLTYPLGLVFGQYPLQAGNLSFLIVAFLPLAFLLARSRRLTASPLAQLTFAALLGTAIWIALRPSQIVPRYLLATLLMFAPLAARAAEAARAGEASPRLLSAGIVLSAAIAMVIVAYPYAAVARHWPAYAAGRADECAMASGYCPVLNEFNRLPARGERVYLAGYYWFWLRPDILQCQQGRLEHHSILLEDDGETRWSELVDRGFRYIAIDRTSHASAIALFDPARAPAWLTARTVKDEGNLVILHVVPRDPARVPRLGCRQIRAPAWDVVELR